MNYDVKRWDNNRKKKEKKVILDSIIKSCTLMSHAKFELPT